MAEEMVFFQDKQECYFCGKKGTEEFGSVFKAIEEELDAGIELCEKRFEEAKKKYLKQTEKLLKLLKSVDEANLDFTIRTIRTDINIFKEKISQLDQILKHYEQNRGHKEEWTIRSMLDRVEQYHWGKQWPIVESASHELDKAKEAKQKVLEIKQSPQFNIYTVPFGEVFNLPRLHNLRDVTYNIYICAICNHFFDTANEWRNINFLVE